MKASKLWKVWWASSMSLALAAGVSVLPATAAGVTDNGGGETSIAGIAVTDTVKTDGNTYAPNTTMTIAVTPGGEKTFHDGTSDVTAAGGVDGGLTGTTIAFAPDAGKEVSDIYSATGMLTVDDSVFDVPGVYHYVVSQTAGDYSGMTYDTGTYDVYLYVVNNAAYDDLYVSYAVSVKDGEAAKTDILFENDYGHTHDTTHDVTVVKQVTGSHGNTTTQDFTFDVSVAGTQGEIYKVVVDYDNTTTNGEKDKTITIQANAGATQVTVKHNGTITIYGLSDDDTYTIAETDVSALGYTVDNDKSHDATGTVTGITNSDGERYTVTNTKNAVTPTGIILNIAPYALMVVIAAAGVMVFMGKRVEE